MGKKYISFRKNGLCVEIKDWVKEQRIEFENKTISNENLLRLQAVDFPFKAKDNEHYKLTKQSCWDLREKLDNKVNRFKVKRQKELSVYEKKKSWYGTKKQLEKLKKSRKEVNSFYNRKYSFCSPLSLKKLNETEALKSFQILIKGFLIQILD